MRVVYFCWFCVIEIFWWLYLCEKIGDEDEEDVNVYGFFLIIGFGVLMFD